MAQATEACLGCTPFPRAGSAPRKAWTRAVARAEGIISDTVRDRLGDAHVRSVLVAPDRDSDGDPIFRVTVVLGPGSGPDPARMAGLVRHIRSKLEEVQADEFPLVRFVSVEDAAKLKREPA